MHDIQGRSRCNGTGDLVSVIGTKAPVLNETHNFRRETGVVGKVRNCVVEIEQICLVTGLELMEEVEDLEGEDSVWLDQRGGEQSSPEQLLTAVGGVFRSTHTVSNDDLMDTTEIKHSKLITPGWVWADLVGPVTELHHKAEGSEGFGREVLSIPSLRSRISNVASEQKKGVPQRDGGGGWSVRSRDTAGTPDHQRNNLRSGIDRGPHIRCKSEGHHRAPPRSINHRGPPPYEATTLPISSAGGSARPNVVSEHGDLPRRLCFYLSGLLAVFLLLIPIPSRWGPVERTEVQV